MASASYHISNLLEKMTSSDKDFRFMATNDLMTELQKDSIKLDDDSERKVVRMILKLLEDKNGEVQNLAVKCYSLLGNRSWGRLLLGNQKASWSVSVFFALRRLSPDSMRSRGARRVR
uniref:Cullin-associated and neddylation-dissociated 1 n=1 Tax=Poecilia reticulata TaxID=8081 RepID=A0A3P9NEE0_POERE